MKTIYKYKIPITDTFSLQLPVDAEILCFQIDIKTGTPTIWVKLIPETEYEQRNFALVGTGNPIEFEDGNYIGTVQLGYFVWHLFELIPQH